LLSEISNRYSSPTCARLRPVGSLGVGGLFRDHFRCSAVGRSSLGGSAVGRISLGGRAVGRSSLGGSAGGRSNLGGGLGLSRGGGGGDFGGSA
jgi:hypothetical protein